jgi:hypothetical protein
MGAIQGHALGSRHALASVEEQNCDAPHLLVVQGRTDWSGTLAPGAKEELARDILARMSLLAASLGLRRQVEVNASESADLAVRGVKAGLGEEHAHVPDQVAGPLPQLDQGSAEAVTVRLRGRARTRLSQRRQSGRRPRRPGSPASTVPSANVVKTAITSTSESSNVSCIAGAKRRQPALHRGERSRRARSHRQDYPAVAGRLTDARALDTTHEGRPRGRPSLTTDEPP